MKSRQKLRKHTGLVRSHSTFAPSNLFSKKRELSTYQILAKQEEHLEISAVRLEKLKLAEYICSLLALTGFGCAAIAYDKSFSESLYEEYTLEVDTLLVFCSISTFCLLISIVWRTMCELQWRISKRTCSKLDNLFSSGLYKTLIIELVLNGIHAPYGSVEFFEDEQNALRKQIEQIPGEVRYSYLAVLSVLMIVRIYHFIRLACITSEFRNERSQRICYIYGTNAGMIYSLKCLFSEKSIAVSIVGLIVGVFLFAYSLRVFERPIEFASGEDFSDYGNCMWTVVITMTTVGYGDFKPRTAYGRAVGFAACVYGVMVVSFVVIIIFQFFDMDLSDQKSLLIMHRLRFKEEKRKTAAMFVISFMKILRLKRLRKSDKEIEEQVNDYRKNYALFYDMKQKERALYNSDAYEERVERKLIQIEKNATDLQVWSEQMMNLVGEIENNYSYDY